MEERLSSSLTFVQKFLVNALWLGGGGFSLLLNKRCDPIMPIFFLIIAAGLYWSGGRVKKVERVGDVLRISNYFREIEVPLTEVESVSESRLMRTTLISLTFRQPTLFGSTIVFIPKSTVFGGWPRPSMVAQLQEEIARLHSSQP